MSNKHLVPYAALAAVTAGFLAFAGCAVHEATTDKEPVGTAPFDPFDTQHTADADTPPLMFDGDTGVLRVGLDIKPGTYSATPVGHEGMYSIATCLDESNPACSGTAVYVSEPTNITVPEDAAALIIAYLKLGEAK